MPEPRTHLFSFKKKKKPKSKKHDKAHSGELLERFANVSEDTESCSHFTFLSVRIGY